jgi:hypothetical protein
VVVLVMCAALTACVPQGLAFQVDDRLTFSTPEDRSEVSLPVTLDWEIRDFEVVEPGQSRPSEDAGYFAVFVDAAPMPPGKPLRWLARKDTSCRESEGCPDAEYLSSRGVYTTTDTRLVLDQLPRLSNDEDRRERHRAVVVLLNAEGERIGESAFEIEFDVERNGTP